MLRNIHSSSRFFLHLIIIICSITSLLIPLSLVAQTNTTTPIQITTIQTIDDEPNKQQLKVYFVASDSDGHPININNLNSANASLTLTTGDTRDFSGKLENPTDKLYVVIAVQLSTRFGSSERTKVKQAAKNLITSLPKNTFISLVFVSHADDKDPQVTTFSQSQDYSINTIDPVLGTNNATCLYDSLSTAFQTFSDSTVEPNSRHAIVLISDGNDLSTRNDSSHCSSKHTLEEVSNTAATRHIPIYPIPVDAQNTKLQESFLKDLATKSGGTYTPEMTKALADMATDVGTFLGGQILFSTDTLCASSGDHRAVLNIDTQDNHFIGNLSFNLRSNCNNVVTPTPLPPSLKLDANFDTVNETLVLTITKQGAEIQGIERYCISATDESGTSVRIDDNQSNIFKSSESQFKITKEMLQGKSFYGKLQISATACDANGNSLPNTSAPITNVVNTNLTPPTLTPIPPTATLPPPTAIPTTQSPLDTLIHKIAGGDFTVLLCLFGIVAFALVSGLFVVRFAIKPRKTSTILPTVPSRPVSSITVLPEFNPPSTPSQPTRMYEVVSNALPSNVTAYIAQAATDKSWKVTHTPYKIGNSKRGGMRNDIEFLDDQTISSEQAEFDFRAGYFYIKNLGRNAIMVNGEKVPEGLEVALKSTTNNLRIGQQTMLQFDYELGPDPETTMNWQADHRNKPSE